MASSKNAYNNFSDISIDYSQEAMRNRLKSIQIVEASVVEENIIQASAPEISRK